MKNSASIKFVLPALIPEFSYSDLEIGDGSTASELFLESIQKYSLYTPELQENLLKYCERDTYAMVLIYQFLQKLEN